MVDTAIKDEEEKKEFFDSEEELELKIDQLAEWVKESKHFVAFTGAGISTAAGVADFRSGVNTCLETGPGLWEKGAQKIQNFKPKVRVEMSRAFPTKCHMAIVKLIQDGMLKFLISQNVDGLHRKSGVPPEKIAELHGNTNLEKCSKCGRGYMRDFRTRNAQKVHDHETGRLCEDPKCKGKLLDSIINFGENLPAKDLDDGYTHSQFADLMVCIGSSLRVNPAADMPVESVNNGGKLVIINLQKTPLDSIASMVIHGKIEPIVEKLMKKLGKEVPKWKIIRRVKFEYDDKSLLIKSIDSDGKPYSIFKSVTVINKNVSTALTKEPFMFKQPLEKVFELKFQFQGFYDEPELKISLERDKLKKKTYIMEFDPEKVEWEDVYGLEGDI